MYLEYYGLKQMPFALTPDPYFLFRTESHLEVLATLNYAISHNKGLVVLTGESGTGKTTLLRAAMQHFGSETQLVYIFNPFLTAAEFFDQLAEEMGLDSHPAATKSERLSAMGRLLASRHSRNLRTVLIVDEAHGLPTSLLEEIRLLMNFETNNDKLLQVVLSGQPELDDALNRESLRQLKQRVSLRCRVKPLTVFDVSQYIRFRLTQAGAPSVNLFDHTAVALIGQASKGIPRVINNICDNALLYGYASGCKGISRETIEEVVDSLDLSERTISELGNFKFQI
ncbi:MAG TPA: AAA family ATPase [Blastocatellia bacterium]|nr:AAA family ATPase [Blastocatellia bacterium]